MLKRPSFDTQKDVIHNAKGHLLQCERWPFAFLFYCFYCTLSLILLYNIKLQRITPAHLKLQYLRTNNFIF